MGPPITQDGDGHGSMPRVDLHATFELDGVTTPEKTLENILQLQRRHRLSMRIA